MAYVAGNPNSTFDSDDGDDDSDETYSTGLQARLLSLSLTHLLLLPDTWTSLHQFSPFLGPISTFFTFLLSHPTSLKSSGEIMRFHSTILVLHDNSAHFLTLSTSNRHTSIFLFPLKAK